MFRRVLLPLDGSDRAESTLPAVAPLARAFGATVDLLHVVPDRTSMVRPGPKDPLEWRMGRKRAQDYLEIPAARLREAGLNVETHLGEGGPAEVIIDLLLEGRHDLVALSTRGMGSRDLLHLGCTSGAVVLHAPTSILLVPGERGRGGADAVAGAAYRRLAVPVDGTPRSEWALGLGALLAGRERASLVLLHALCRPETFGTVEEERAALSLLETSRSAAADYLAGAAGRHRAAGVEVGTVLLEPDGDLPSRVLDSLGTEGADLVILSAHGGEAGSGWRLAALPLRFLLAARVPTLVLQDIPSRRNAVFVDAPDAGP